MMNRVARYAPTTPAPLFTRDDRIGSADAGALIYVASGSFPVPDFYANNETAIADLRARAHAPEPDETIADEVARGKDVMTRIVRAVEHAVAAHGMCWSSLREFALYWFGLDEDDRRDGCGYAMCASTHHAPVPQAAAFQYRLRDGKAFRDLSKCPWYRASFARAIAYDVQDLLEDAAAQAKRKAVVAACEHEWQPFPPIEDSMRCTRCNEIKAAASTPTPIDDDAIVFGEEAEPAAGDPVGDAVTRVRNDQLRPLAEPTLGLDGVGA